MSDRGALIPLSSLPCLLWTGFLTQSWHAKLNGSRRPSWEVTRTGSTEPRYPSNPGRPTKITFLKKWARCWTLCGTWSFFCFPQNRITACQNPWEELTASSPMKGLQQERDAFWPDRDFRLYDGGPPLSTACMLIAMSEEDKRKTNGTEEMSWQASEEPRSAPDSKSVDAITSTMPHLLEIQ